LRATDGGPEHAFKQQGRQYLKTCRELKKGLDVGEAFGALQLADDVSVNGCPQGQRFLGYAGGPTVVLKVLTESQFQQPGSGYWP
jgi:hypothetical protein